jgi:hypothetical protein
MFCPRGERLAVACGDELLHSLAREFVEQVAHAVVAGYEEGVAHGSRDGVSAH